MRAFLVPVLVRYYLKAIWPPFFLAVAIWLSILNLIFQILPFLDYVFKYQVGLTNSLLSLLYIQPSYLVLVLPIAYMTAILVVFGRLSSDREIMAMEASGVSTSILVWPMIGLSVLISLFLVFFMDTVLPWGNISYLKLDYKIISERSGIVIRERTFINDFDGYLLYIKDKDDRIDLLKGVTVEFLDQNAHPYRVILAKQGKLHQDPANYHIFLDLSDGILQQLGAGKTEPKDEFLSMQFENCALDLSAHKLKRGPMDFRNARNMSIKELSALIDQDRKENRDSRLDETEFHKKFSIPFSALAFAFVGIPLGIVSRVRFLGSLLIGIVFVIVYYLFINSGDALGPLGVMSPFWSMWLPNVVFIVAGLGMIFALHRRLGFWRKLFRGKTGRKTGKGPSIPPRPA